MFVFVFWFLWHRKHVFQLWVMFGRMCRQRSANKHLLFQATLKSRLVWALKILYFKDFSSLCVFPVHILVCSGFISGNRVRCPWHGSCFNVHTGDLEEFPGIDCLPCHKVRATETDWEQSHGDICCLFNSFSFLSFEGPYSKQQSVCIH